MTGKGDTREQGKDELTPKEREEAAFDLADLLKNVTGNLDEVYKSLTGIHQVMDKFKSELSDANARSEKFGERLAVLESEIHAERGARKELVSAINTLKGEVATLVARGTG